MWTIIGIIAVCGLILWWLFREPPATSRHNKDEDNDDFPFDDSYAG